MRSITSWLSKWKEGKDAAKVVSGLLILFFIGVGLWLLQKNFILAGQETYVQDFSSIRQQGFSSFFLSPGPEYNLEQKEYYQRLTKSPVKIEFRRPYFASAMEFSMTVQPHGHPSIQVGVSSEKFGGRRFDPLDLKVVDDLLNNDRFIVFDEDAEVAFMRRLTNEEAREFEDRNDGQKSSAKLESNKETLQPITSYSDRDQFYRQPLGDFHLGIVNASSEALTKIPGLKEDGQTIRLEQSIRGTHRLLVYVTDRGVVDFRFELKDQNALEGKDEFKLRISSVTGDTVYEQRLSDDGKTGSKGPETQKEVAVIKQKGLPEGVYFLDLETTSDVWIESIETSNRFWAFRERLTLVEPSMGSTLYTDRPHLALMTNRKIGLQTITSGENRIELVQTGEAKELLLGKGYPPIQVSVSDVIATNEGLIALHPDARALFNVRVLSPLEDWKNLDYLVVGKTWGARVETLKDGSIKMTRSYAMSGIPSGRNRQIEFWIDTPSLNQGSSDLFVTSVSAKVKRRSLSEIVSVLFDQLF